MVALDRRLMTHEDWCERQGVEPARRPRPDATAPTRLRLVEYERQAVNDAPVLCGDCTGSGIVADEDGWLSGQVGCWSSAGVPSPARPVGARGVPDGAGPARDGR